MNRVRVLLLGLLALFIYPSSALAEIACSGVFAVQNVTNLCYYPDRGTTMAQRVGEGAVMQITPDGLGYFNPTEAGYASTPANSTTCTTGYQISWLTAHVYHDCEQTPCDSSDDDNDGICNSCDQNPGAPDHKHCIWYQFKIPFTDTVLFSLIDRSGNCDGSNTVITSNSSVPNATNTSDWNGFFKPMKYEINAPNCSGDDGQGQCGCDYDYDDEPLLHNQEIVIDVSLADDLKNQLQKNDNDLNDDDKPNNCTTLKSNCSSSCATRGGVAASTCYSKDGQSYSSCTCADEYGYSINNPVSDDSTSDTNENGSSDDTGGSDSNSDGVDDFYAAVKGAIKDSGILTKQDVTNSNLGQISDDLGVINSNINGLGTKLDGIDSGIDGLGGKIDSMGNDIQGLGSKLDSINDKLGQGFEATGDAALPSSNDYDSDVENIDEDNLGEAIGNYISSGLPLVSYFHGTYIDIGSSSPSLSTEIYGRTVSIDFTGLEDILNNMGLVLVAIATVLAFMIIVHKG